ncbi:hypothetical protein [Paenisporosarcina indica]|uniref:hypothetical protein n=1 Tax=Paenisporosarcina indica TaxID=650093 RepID=UPI00094FC4A2|nr:hypothetical protein [Paenisporosarcina indica]
MKNLYARYSTYSFRAGILASIAVPLIAFLTYIKFFSDLQPLINVLLVGFISFGSSTYFKKASRKLSETMTNTETHDFSVNEFNFQTDISFHSRLYLVSHEGEQLFVVEPTKQKPISRYLTVFSLVSSGLIIPITYDVMSLNRSKVFSFTMKNEWKQFRVTVTNEQDVIIGEYIQPWRTSTFKNKGILYLGNLKLPRKIESKNMTGDIDIHDEDSLLTASYRFGIFPYALHPAFQAISTNTHIKLGPHISTDERKVYLAIFYFWLYGR